MARASNTSADLVRPIVPRLLRAPRLADASVVSGLLVVAAVLRFHNLGLGSLWLDEIMSVHDAKYIWSFTRDATQANYHPPLYFFIVWLLSHLGTSEMLFRLPSAVFCSLTVGLVYWFARRAYGWFPATVGAALLAASVTSIQQAQEARDYAITAFLITLNLCLALRALRGWSLPVVVGLALSVAASLYISYWSLFGVGTLFACLLARSVVRYLRHEVYQSELATTAATLIGMLAWIPWFPQFWIFLHQSTVLGRPAASLADALSGVQHFVANVLVVGEFWLVVLLALAAYGALRRWRSWATVVLTLTIVAYLGAIPTRLTGFETRYLSFILPCFFILVALGIEQLVADLLRLAKSARLEVTPRTAGTLGVVVALVVISQVELSLTSKYFVQPPVMAAWGDAAAYVAASYRPGDVVVNTDVDFSYLCFPYYAARTRPAVSVVTLDRPGTDLPDLLGKAATGGRLWWVMPSSPERVKAVQAALGDRYGIYTFEATYPAAIAIVRSTTAGGTLPARLKQNAEVLDAFAAATPDDWSVADTDGLAHEAEGDLPTAEQRFRQSLALAANNSWVEEDLARVLTAEGKFAEAETWYRAAIDLDSRMWNYRDLAWHYLGLGNLYIEQKRYDDAQAVFAQGLNGYYAHTGDSQEPTDGYLTLRTAQTYEQQQMYDKARVAYESALSYSAVAAEGHRGLARVYLAQGLPDAALSHLQAAIQAEPSSPWPLLDLGDFYRSQKQPDAALAAYTKARDIAPNQMWVWLRLGDFYGGSRRWTDAIDAYQQAAHLAPDDYYPVKSEADAYRELGQWAKALPLYQTALQMNPKDPDVYDGLGYVQRSLGKTSEALATFQKGAAISSHHFWLQFHLGETYLMLNDRPHALEAFKHAAEVQPDDHTTLQYIAELGG